MRQLLPLLLLAACASTQVTVFDVEDAFEADLAGLGLRVPSRNDLDPARCSDAPLVFAKTTAWARRYLATDSGSSLNRRFVSALLACACLARGHQDAARDAMLWIHEGPEEQTSRENRVSAATMHAVGAVRGILAREGLDATLAGAMTPLEYVSRYGWSVGISLPAREDPGYGQVLDREVLAIQRICGPESEENAARQDDLRRLASEHVYNEAASLLVACQLPGEGRELSAPERWLAIVALNVAVVHGQLMEDLVPYPLSDAQKQWQKEQLLPFYERAKALAGHFLTDADRALVSPEARQGPSETQNNSFHYLYARLLDSEIAAIGWIETR